ncbi:MAG: DMT family transporter [Planktomarina sp.]
MPLYALTMFAAGIGIPLLAALNAGLGRHLGAPMVAGVVLFGVAFITALAVALATGIGPITKLATAPKHLLLGGVLIAFYVLSITAIAPHFGVGNAVMFVLLGQLVSAAAIDHFGLFGAQIAHLTLTRAAGITLMVAGVVLVQKG